MDRTKRPDEPPGDVECPRRAWVVRSLSDDDEAGNANAVSQALQLHLVQCPSCKRVADQLAGVTETLRGLGDGEPPEALLARANEQVGASLRQGGALTGRVSIPDDDGPICAVRGATFLARYARYALAASILLALGLTAVWVLNRPAPSSQLADVAKPGPAAPRPTAPAGRPGPTAGGSQGEAMPARRATVLADTGRSDAEPPPARTRARPYRYRSYVDAALCDDPHYVHRAVVLPRRRSSKPERGLEIGRLLSAFEEFDTSRRTRSTNRGPDGK
jgi:hypothetical protein